jgi:hypothetical protein
MAGRIVLDDDDAFAGPLYFTLSITYANGETRTRERVWVVDMPDYIARISAFTNWNTVVAFTVTKED